MASRKVFSTVEHNIEHTEEEPPKPARSAFMCFSAAKTKELQSKGVKKQELLKQVAALWRELTDRERADWAEEARKDKLRFIHEKAAYKGPWKVPKRRAKKHPAAPKRSMSAFLKFSQKHRAIVKKNNPDLENTDVSRLLGEMWRASKKENQAYVEQELQERATYKQQIAEFRAQQTRIETAASSRTMHASIPTLECDVPRIKAPPMEASAYSPIHHHATHYPYRHPHPHEAHAASLSSSRHQHHQYHHSPAHYRRSSSQAPSFDAFVDSIPDPQQPLSPLHLAPLNLSPLRLNSHDIWLPPIENGNTGVHTEENRFPLILKHYFS